MKTLLLCLAFLMLSCTRRGDTKIDKDGASKVTAQVWFSYGYYDVQYYVISDIKYHDNCCITFTQWSERNNRVGERTVCGTFVIKPLTLPPK